MIAIFRKEVNLFFSSLIGYISIAIFLLVNGLICWVLPETNLLDTGYADLFPLFQWAPWVMMFLIPAITMSTFAEEKNKGTIELLATKPVSDNQIIGGKYLAALFLVAFSVLPTIVYYFGVSELASPRGNVDTGAMMGSYIGLLLLGASFVAIGLFTSAISNNQIVAFIMGLFFCFIGYLAFDSLGQLPGLVGTRFDDLLNALSINTHYLSISKGVIDTRDIVYFGSLIALFFAFTKTALESRKW